MPVPIFAGSIPLQNIFHHDGFKFDITAPIWSNIRALNYLAPNRANLCAGTRLIVSGRKQSRHFRAFCKRIGCQSKQGYILLPSKDPLPAKADYDDYT